MSQPNTPQTVIEFKRALAAALLTAAREQAVTRTVANDMAGNLGLPRFKAVVTDTGTGYETGEIEEEKLIHGRARELYTAEYQAEYDAKRLTDLRRSAYNDLKYRAEIHDLKEDLAVRTCEALGLPVPGTVTTVTWAVTGAGSGSFMLDGEISKASIAEKLAPLVSDPNGDKIRELFPEAKGLADRVRVEVRHRRSWPDFSA